MTTSIILLKTFQRFDERLWSYFTSSYVFQEMIAKLRVIYNLILHLETVQESLFTLAESEHDAVVKIRRQVQLSEKPGKFGVTLKDEIAAKERKAKFSNNLLLTKRQIKQISRSYRQFVHDYLALLTSSPDLNLQLLCERLNFNNYYKIMWHTLTNYSNKECKLRLQQRRPSFEEVMPNNCDNILKEESHIYTYSLQSTPESARYGSVNSLLRTHDKKRTNTWCCVGWELQMHCCTYSVLHDKRSCTMIFADFFTNAGVLVIHHS